MTLVLTCGDAASDRVPPRGTHAVAVAEVPTRDEIDPLLADGTRLVVVGDDAALAAVLVRLLRCERLDVALGFVPVGRSEAAAVWGLPPDHDAACTLALEGEPRPSVLVRDDRGGVAVGAHRLGAFTGEVYADERLVSRGAATGMVVRPDPDRHGVAVTVTGPSRWGGLRAPTASGGRGRAVQVGCRGAAVERDGVADARSLQRRSWYPHLEDWRFVRP